MITKFATVYPGHVDLPDMGQGATPANDRRFPNEHLPNILMVAVHLAHVPPRIRIGCGFNITPMWHPLRLAEDFATADILTRGRIIFGVGRGYHSREGGTFGSPML